MERLLQQPEHSIPNETWVIVGSVAEPTITNFHLSWGENGYAVASTTPSRHLSRVAPLDIPPDIFIRRSPPAVAEQSDVRKQASGEPAMVCANLDPNQRLD